MKVANWSKWQSYRSDRSAPPWIKVHRNLFSSPKWAVLTDAEKGQLISIWVLAGDRGGDIPSDPLIIKKLAQLDEEPNIRKFIGLGLLDGSLQGDDDAALTSACQPSDVNVTPRRQPDDVNVRTRNKTVSQQSREEETRGEETRLEERREERHLSTKVDDASEIFNFWSLTMSKAGTAKFTDKRRKAVKARLKEGYTKQQLRDAIVGCSATRHNMGDNQQRKRFDCLELICRTGENVERFIENNKPAAPPVRSSLMEQNLAVLQSVELK